MSTYYNSVFDRHISYGGMEKQALKRGKLLFNKFIGELSDGEQLLKELKYFKGKGKDVFSDLDLGKQLKVDLDNSKLSKLLGRFKGGEVDFDKPLNIDLGTGQLSKRIGRLAGDAERSMTGSAGDGLVDAILQTKLPTTIGDAAILQTKLPTTLGDDAVLGTFRGGDAILGAFRGGSAAGGPQVSLPLSHFKHTGLKIPMSGAKAMPSGTVNLGETTHWGTLAGSGIDDAIARTVETNPVFASYVGSEPKASLLSRLLNHLPDKQTQLTLAALAPLYGQAGYDIYKDIADDDDKD